MKSILLKTLAAVSLVAAAHSEVHVLGAVWKERGLSAPDGDIIPNPGTVASTRGYLIFDESILTATPGPGTLIQYRDARSGGVIQRIYTIDNTFRAFHGDVIDGDSGGRRIYGHIHAPNTIANVADARMPYSGTPFPTGYPSKLRFDTTVFQVGTATPLTGPRIVDLNSSLARSVISGNASSINVEATTIAGATAELEARLVKAGFNRGATVPVVTTDLPATLALIDGQSQGLSVGVGNAFPAPTYQWYKGATAIPAASGGTLPTYTVTGGASTATNGLGAYRVEVSTSAGTAISGTTTVTAQQFTFATNLPATTPIISASTATLGVVLNPTPITPPTYQWFKGATAIAAAIGGTSPTLLVIGGEAATGAGSYRVEVTSSAGTLVSLNTVVTITLPGTNFVFTTNTPRTATPAFAGTVTLAPIVNTAAVPAQSTATRQWFKAPLADPTAFVAIASGDGGTGLTYVVTGNNTAVNGPGVYRLVVTSTALPITTITSNSTVVTTAP